MTVLSYAQLEGLWLDASQGTKYHDRKWAALMAAIAEAESGGNTDALNPHDNNGTQSSYGLWQISNGTHTPPSPGWADPATNAKLAIGKLDSQGVGAWGTYNSGAYRAYVSGSTTPDMNIPGNPGALAAQAGAASAQDCLIGGEHIGIIFGAGPTLPCLFTMSNARAFIGAGLMAVGGLTVWYGGSIVVLAAGIKALAPAAKKVGPVVALIPGGQVAGGAITAAGQAGSSGSAEPLVRFQRSRQSAADDERAAERRLGQPRENPELRTGRGAIRETRAGTAERRRAAAASRSRARRTGTSDDVPPF